MVGIYVGMLVGPLEILPIFRVELLSFSGVKFDVVEHPLPTKDFQTDSRQTVLHENPQGTRRDRPVNRKRSTFPVRQLLMWFPVSFLTYLSYFLSYIKRKPLL